MRAFPSDISAVLIILPLIDRLENEHLGNMDQYRVTREVPLPYPLDISHEDDHEDADDERLRKVRG